MPDFTVEQNAGFVTHADPDQDDDGPLTVRGIALGEGIAKGKTSDGEDEPSYYSPEVLEEAAEDLVGKHIVDDSNHDDLESLQPPNEAIVGEVTDARHKDGVGLAFEGQIHREPEKSLVDAGLMDVSPSVWRAHDEYDDDLGGRPVRKIGWWRDLAVVNSGGSPAATIEASSAAEALQAEAGTDALDADMVGEALAETFDESGAHAGGGGGNKPGDGESPGREMPDDDTPSDNPGGDAGVEELRAELERLREENETLREQVDGSKDEEIQRLQERISTLEDENNSLESDVEPVEGAAAEALSEQTGLSEEMVRQRWDGAGDMISTLTEGDDQPDDVAEVLQFTPNPQTGDPGDPGDPGGNGGGLADLSGDDREEVESLLARAETFDGTNDQIAESLRSDAADLADVEDADELVGEVL